MGKITLTNIAEELAIRSGLDKEAADSFVRAFINTVERGLETDHLVKVKGLGTFKLMEMNDRSSVDVNSGERITIKGYTKVSFTPDSSMKEFVNRPFAHFEPTELNEGYPEEELVEDSAEETTQEIVEEVLPEESLEEATEKVAEKAIEETAEEDSTTIAEATDVVPTDIPLEEAFEETQEEVTNEELELEENICDAPQPIEQEPVSTNNEPVETEQMELKEQPVPEVVPQGEHSRRGRWLLALLLVALVGGGYYYITMGEEGTQETGVGFDEHGHIAVNPNLEEELGAEWGDLSPKKSEPSVIDSTRKDTVAVVVPADTIAQSKPNSIMVDESVKVEPVPAPTLAAQGTDLSARPDTLVIVPSLASKDIKDITPADTCDYLILGTQTTHKLRNGETLIMLSRKYYGDKRLWPYIVKHNDITDFNKVAIGMSVSIPELQPAK